MLCLSVFTVIGAMAQDDNRTAGTVNKRGNYILPKAGDFAIGVSVNPFASYLGNMFNGSDDNDAPWLIGQNYELTGKYFLRDNRAIRFSVDFGFYRNEMMDFVPDQARLITEPEVINPTVADRRFEKYNYFSVSAGYEFRRGYGRLQAFWGGEAYFAIDKNTGTAKYGNAMTDINQTPATSNFNGDGSWNYVGERMLSYKDTYFTFGAKAFIGVEYFIAPKISLGAELGLRFGYKWLSQGVGKFETYDANAGGVRTWEERYTMNVPWYDIDATGDELTFTTTPDGNINLTFYF